MPREVEVNQPLSNSPPREVSPRRIPNRVNSSFAARLRRDPTSTEESDEPRYSVWYLLYQVTRLFCWVGCPPVPELITRKVAFHPRKAKENYFLMGKPTHEGEEIVLDSLHEIKKMKSVHLAPARKPHRALEHNYAWLQDQRSSEVFTTKTKQGSQLLGLWVKSNCRWVQSHSRSNRVILFSDSNASDLGHWIHQGAILGKSLKGLADFLCADVVGYDYSGFGYSTGTACERNIYADVEAIYNHILKTRGDDVEIVLMGFSMGTAASIDLASKQPKKLVGLVLVAPFASAFGATSKDPDNVGCFCLNRFLSIDKVAHITVPTLLIHGSKDWISIKNSHALERRLPNPVEPLYVEGRDHCDILDDPKVAERVWEYVFNETRVQKQ